MHFLITALQTDNRSSSLWTESKTRFVYLSIVTPGIRSDTAGAVMITNVSSRRTRFKSGQPRCSWAGASRGRWLTVAGCQCSSVAEALFVVLRVSPAVSLTPRPDGAKRFG